jgi:hypothetical protein
MNSAHPLPLAGMQSPYLYSGEAERRPGEPVELGVKGFDDGGPQLLPASRNSFTSGARLSVLTGKAVSGLRFDLHLIRFRLSDC